MKRIATLETLRKEWSRRNLHAPSLTRLHAPHPTPPRDPLPHLSHLPHNPLPSQNHSPPDYGIFSFSLIETIFTPLQRAATSLRMLPKCKRYIPNVSPLRCVCFITAGPITKLFAWGGGGEWRTCAMRDDEPRPVWMSLLITH